MVSFGYLQFDPEVENIPDHMLMSGKQFKILNHKLNSLLWIQADIGIRNTVSDIEVDVLLKAQEHRSKTTQGSRTTQTCKITHSSYTHET